MRPLRARILATSTLLTLAVVAACGMDDGVTPAPTADAGVDATPALTPNPTTTSTPPVDGAPDADVPDTFVPVTDAGADADAATPSDPSVGDPDPFDPSEYDTERDIDTTDNAQRRPISPLIYGINSFDVSTVPAAVLKSITFVRRGGDRVNTYNWETNLSANSTEQDDATAENGYDLLPSTIAGSATARVKPAALDLDMITRLRSLGISSMIPFTLNDYVSKKAGSANWNGWNLTSPARTTWFDRNHPVSPGPFLAEPDTSDNAVYADEHVHYLKTKLGDIYAPGATRVLVGIDNEPDIYHLNYPFLQAGNGENLHPPVNGATNVVGKIVDGNQFTDEKFLPFAKSVKAMDANAFIIGPDHYHYDGITTWEMRMENEYSDGPDGKWFMEGFLDKVRTASETAGQRLLDLWDFHWYPQYTVGGTEVEDLQASAVNGNANARDAVLNAPREFWDETFTGNSNAWYTGADLLNGPSAILKRIKQRIAAHYPGTPVGVSEYWPGGCGSIYNGLAVADMLGVFQREDVGLGAMWPSCGDTNLDYSYGAFKLLRNADGNGLKFASVYAPVTNPAAVAVEKAERALSSVYAGSDDKTTMTVLVINKSASTRRFALRAKHSAELKTVGIHRIEQVAGPRTPDPAFVRTDTLAKKNSYLYAAPPFSASLLVFTN